MCLAIPMKLISREGHSGVAETDGVQLAVALSLCPESDVGDWLIVHAGYALSVMDEDAAHETLQLLKEIGETAS